jgi:hypothetical protein
MTAGSVITAAAGGGNSGAGASLGRGSIRAGSLIGAGSFTGRLGARGRDGFTDLASGRALALRAGVAGRGSLVVSTFDRRAILVPDVTFDTFKG